MFKYEKFSPPEIDSNDGPSARDSDTVYLVTTRREGHQYTELDDRRLGQGDSSMTRDESGRADSKDKRENSLSKWLSPGIIYDLVSSKGNDSKKKKDKEKDKKQKKQNQENKDVEEDSTKEVKKRGFFSKKCQKDCDEKQKSKDTPRPKEEPKHSKSNLASDKNKENISNLSPENGKKFGIVGQEAESAEKQPQNETFMKTLRRHMKNKGVCSVCSENDKPTSVLSLEGCQHKFCGVCTFEILKKNNACPLCTDGYLGPEYDIIDASHKLGIVNRVKKMKSDFLNLF